MTLKERLAKSVESLQRLYAIVVALAVAECLRRFLLDPTSNEFAVQWNHWPAFVAFLFTVIPFFHGMNRHLEEAYLIADPRRAPQVALLLLDFLVFFVEACVLFALAAMLDAGLWFFLSGGKRC